MFKKSYLRVAAVLVCLAFLVTTVPALHSAEKKAAKSAPVALKSSLRILGFLFPLIGSLVDTLGADPRDKMTGGQEPSQGLLPKPTGDAPSTGEPKTKD